MSRRRSSRTPNAPLLGALPSLLRDPLHTLEAAARARPGEVAELHLGPVPIYLVTQPAHVQRVLVENTRNYIKGRAMWRPLRRLLGDGLVTADGEAWLKNRRMMQPLFSNKNVAALAEIMIPVIADDATRFETAIATGRVVDIEQEMMMVTQRVILATMFGASVDRSEAEALGNALQIAFRVINPRMFLFFLPERFPLPGERTLIKAIQTIDDAVLRMFEARRKSGEARDDFLSLLLCARDEDGSSMSMQQIRDELVTLFVAGNETTAVTMTWLWYVLDRYPEVDRKVREEIATVLGTRIPTYADLENLVYTKRVIQETLRLYPPAWFLPRFAVEDDVIDDVRIPAGSTVLLSQHVTHRDPMFWDDPERFDPDRFLPEHVAKRPRYAFLPFGGGPRQCIGMQFAYIESLLITAMMAQKFRPRLLVGHPVVPAPATTLRPRHGMKMVLLPA